MMYEAVVYRFTCTRLYARYYLRTHCFCKNRKLNDTARRCSIPKVCLVSKFGLI